MNNENQLYKHIASALIARANCEKSNNAEWFARHTDTLEKLCDQFMPSGSGVDCGTKIDLERSKPDRLIFTFSYHHMDQSGGYAGWTDHQLIVTPSLAFGYDTRITGRDRNQVKEYFYDLFGSALSEVIGCEIRDGADHWYSVAFRAHLAEAEANAIPMTPAQAASAIEAKASEVRS
jgi:hypothetical protein